MLGVVLRGFRDGSHEICVFFCPHCQWKITSCSLRLGERFSPLQELWFLFSNGEANYFCSCLSLVWPREETLRQLHPTTKVRYRPTRRVGGWLCVRVYGCLTVSTIHAKFSLSLEAAGSRHGPFCTAGGHCMNRKGSRIVASKLEQAALLPVRLPVWGERSRPCLRRCWASLNPWGNRGGLIPPGS